MIINRWEETVLKAIKKRVYHIFHQYVYVPTYEMLQL